MASVVRCKSCDPASWIGKMVPEILALRQEKDDEYDDQSRRGERIH